MKLNLGGGDAIVTRREGMNPWTFWNRVAIDVKGCWEWLGERNQAKYGRIRVGDKFVGAHRFAYEMCIGPIPKGAVLDHLCRNPSCVRPDHLEAVTQRENVLRGRSPNALRAAQTVCLHGHLLDEDNTYRDKRGRRSCKACRRERQIEFRMRRRSS